MKRTAQARIVSLFVVSCLSLLFVLTSSSPVLAYSFTRAIETTIEPTSDTEVKVTQKQRLSWNKPGMYFPASKNFAYAYIFPAFASQETSLDSLVRNIKVVGDNGKSLTYSSVMVDGALQLKIPYYEDLDSSTHLVMTLTYTTSMYLLKEGGLTEIFFPGLSKDFRSRVTREKEDYEEVTSYKLAIILPTNLGEISSVFPTPSSQNTVKEKTTLTFGLKELSGNFVNVIIGTERYVKFVLSGKTYATNESSPDFVRNLLINTIEVALPTQQSGTEFSNQTVYYTKIEPFPTKLSVDLDGNVIAQLPVSAAKEGEILIEGYAVIRKGPPVTAVKDVQISSIPANMSTYLVAENRYWQVDDLTIKETADSIKTDSGLLLETVRNTTTFVTRKLTYANIEDEASLRRSGAVGALQQKVGVCMEYSDLLLTLLRAKGIPTRAVFGDGVGNQVNRSLTGIGHQWVGVWVPESGWIPVDPTWSSPESSMIGHDFDHFVWYVASKSVDEPSGFNCSSSDSKSPCKEALQISTEPVDELPKNEVLLTMADLRQKIDANATVDRNVVVNGMQQMVGYLGGSPVGRAVLSKQGLLILFAVFLYGVLVMAVAGVSRLVKKKSQNSSKVEGV